MPPTLRVKNRCDLPFEGWVRTVLDRAPFGAMTSGYLSTGVESDGDPAFVLGDRVGEDCVMADVWVRLKPQSEITFDYDEPLAAELLRRAERAFEALGRLTINGEEMVLHSLVPDGAGLRLRARRRVGDLLLVEVDAMWYPELPGVLHGVATLVASNTGSSSLVQSLTSGVVLRFGDALVVPWSSGFMLGASLVESGAVFADGQARIVPFTLGWPLIIEGGSSLSTAVCLAQRGIDAVGISRLYPEGNPHVAVEPMAVTDGGTWVDTVVRSWGSFPLGIARQSSVSGDQEDQLVHGEVMLDLSACRLNYLAALQWPKRPCHHRTPMGDIVRAADHPGTMMWEGRPHFAAPDRLGKLAPLTYSTNGWWGPDEEHWLVGRLYEAARTSGCRGLQAELEQQAQLYLFASTLPQGDTANWFTSTPGAARAVGYKAMLVHRLWHSLANRALAAEVVARFSDVLRLVLLPRYETVDTWDTRLDDPRLGPGYWWMPWQQAVGAYGVWLASNLPTVPEDLRKRGQDMAQLAAQAVFRDGFVRSTDGWKTRPMRPVGPDPRAPDSSFNHFGMPLALATILSAYPEHDGARDAWAFLNATATSNSARRWLVPLPR